MSSVLVTQKPPYLWDMGAGMRSLTMTYFHTGICTIIGAKAFHCPVRDGKEWDHLAMVVRHKRLFLLLLLKEKKPIHRVFFSFLIASTLRTSRDVHTFSNGFITIKVIGSSLTGN
jgi:hypothetical protein